MKIDSQKVKEITYSLGVDLCGIASADNFDMAPIGFAPREVMPSCNSVIVFACRFPVGTIQCESPMPYTKARNSMTAKMDAIAIDLCIALEKEGMRCAPIPAGESIWDKRRERKHGVISLKHSAEAAGLGFIGRHSLLVTPEYGSMIWLGGILCDGRFSPDERKENLCTNCNVCVEACPAKALEEAEVNQVKCNEYAFGDDEDTKVWRIACHSCRDSCPYNLGELNK